MQGRGEGGFRRARRSSSHLHVFSPSSLPQHAFACHFKAVCVCVTRIRLPLQKVCACERVVGVSVSVSSRVRVRARVCVRARASVNVSLFCVPRTHVGLSGSRKDDTKTHFGRLRARKRKRQQPRRNYGQIESWRTKRIIYIYIYIYIISVITDLVARWSAVTPAGNGA